MRGHLPIADQRCSLRAIKISLTCGLAFIICFLQKRIADARFAPKLRVPEFGQASIFPVFTANRSPAVRGTVLICALYQWDLIVLGLSVSSSANVLESRPSQSPRDGCDVETVTVFPLSLNLLADFQHGLLIVPCVVRV
jgi:hypothetical protein